MNTLKYLSATIILFILFTLQACNSGKNPPADSHPGSGSVKPGVNSGLDKQSDTTKKDTSKN